MEKFMLIFHGGQMEYPSPEDMQANMSQWLGWIEKLAKQNKYVSGEPLLPGGKLISGKDGKTVTDGPYTEGKEVVGGYFIINAENMDEAVAISKDYPDYDKGGTVQVRQVMKVDM
ncbi:MAG: YciI family protein [Agriterribacter sp.]